jgi:hypothetical protein
MSEVGDIAAVRAATAVRAMATMRTMAAVMGAKTMMTATGHRNSPLLHRSGEQESVRIRMGKIPSRHGHRLRGSLAGFVPGCAATKEVRCIL